MPKVELHSYQGQAFTSQKRFIALVAGTGGGKSFFGSYWLFNEISKYPTDFFLVVAPQYKMLERVVIPRIHACFKGTYFEGDFKETKLQYLLPTGGVIYFGSADNPDSLEGVHVRAVWLDEAALMSYALWVIIQARVGQTSGRVLITTTPRGCNWLYTEVYKKFLDGDPNYDVIQFRSCDNPYYPKEEYERMRKTLDSRIFEMRYCGQFRKMTGLVYPDFGIDNIVDSVPTSFIEMRAGCDFGYNNPSAITVLGKDNDGVWWVVDEWYERGKLLEDVINQAKIFKNKYPIGCFFCDPSRPDYIQVFNQNNLPALGAENSISLGIQVVGSLIRSKCLKVLRNCKNTLEEFELYHYPSDEKKDVPVKEQDHAMDALRYGLVGLGLEEQAEEEIIITGEDLGLERVKIGKDY